MSAPRPSRTVRLTASDGYALEASVFTGTGRDAIVMAGATGVKRSFYDAFARAMVGHGFTVVTLDYRGVGGSRPKALKGFHATMRQWGELDLDAALRWTLRELEPDRLLVVGHSVGGQLFGHASAADEVAAAFFVGSQSGYWRHWPTSGKVGIFALWHFLIPALSRPMGYFPSRWFGLGQDLPMGVARQWAHWGRHPDYLLRDGDAVRARYARIRAPLAATAIAKDRFAPEAGVRALLAMYPNAQRRLVLEGDVGHFDWFKAKNAPLWDKAAAWLKDPKRPAGESFP
ncbi:MAG: alpha/beta fold hydrolase [Candidatus Thermoplasmatota archaeon]|jgi:predicted alpha/beta hydrolase